MGYRAQQNSKARESDSASNDETHPFPMPYVHPVVVTNLTMEDQKAVQKKCSTEVLPTSDLLHNDGAGFGCWGSNVLYCSPDRSFTLYSCEGDTKCTRGC